MNEGNVYVLQLQNAGQAIFIDARRQFIRFNVQTNFENLRGLIESFHVTNIFLDRQIEFGEDDIKFFESCGTTLKNFELNVT